MSSRHKATARIVAERVSFSRPDGRRLFHDLTLAFGNERAGVIGPNGVGKSTLAELLVGRLTPAEGVVRRVGRITYLAQAATSPPEEPIARALGIEVRLAALMRAREGHATVADLEAVGDAWDLDARVQSALERFDLAHVPLERAVGTLSGGEGARLALARLLIEEPDFVILDEPSNHLDESGRAALGRFINDWPRGLLCITHDRATLRRMDRIVALSESGVRVFGGGYDEYRAARAAEIAAAEREWHSARAALERAEKDAQAHRERQARRDARGRRQRATANMPKLFLNDQRASAEATRARVLRVTEREVEERRARVRAARAELDACTLPRFSIRGAAVHATRTLLSFTDVTVHFADATRPVLEEITMRVTGPERIALIGPNGSGKSTLLKVAAGLIAPASGEVRRALPSATAYLDQQGLSLDPAATVLENFTAAHPRIATSEARHLLARFDFSAEAAEQRVRELSGGARLRAALACALAGTEPPALLLLDEPTNHLDLDAIATLEDALRSYEGAFIVASHDAEFLRAIGVQRTIQLPGERRGP